MPAAPDLSNGMNADAAPGWVGPQETNAYFAQLDDYTPVSAGAYGFDTSAHFTALQTQVENNTKTINAVCP